MRVTLIAKDDVEIYDALGKPKKIAKDGRVLGELDDINGLKLISIVSMDDMVGAVYDESVVKKYFEIIMEDDEYECS